MEAATLANWARQAASTETPETPAPASAAHRRLVQSAPCGPLNSSYFSASTSRLRRPDCCRLLKSLLAKVRLFVYDITAPPDQGASPPLFPTHTNSAIVALCMGSIRRALTPLTAV